MSAAPSTQIPSQTDDLLWRQLKTIPAFRALLRAVEARFYQVIDLPEPVLDVGCGDGHFAAVTFEKRIQAGIDPSWDALQEAEATGMYDLALASGGADLPFRDNHFASAFSNSVLEHIPDVQSVLNEVNRVIQMHGRFVFTTPSHYFTENLGGAAFFTGLGLDGMAERYRNFFNKVSRHAHTDSPEIWAERLAAAGFEIERWQYYFSDDALRALELGHVQGLPAWIIHALTGHWIIAPWESSLKPTENWVRPFYEEPFQDKGAYILFIARKAADGPIEASLPPAKPYSLAELNAAMAPQNEAVLVTSTPPATAVEAPPEKTSEPETAVSPQPEDPGSPLAVKALVGAGLILSALLFAIFGQAAWRADPTAPGRGLLWLGLGAAALGIFIWLRRAPKAGRRWQWPRLQAFAPRRWLFLPAVLLIFIALRLVAPAAQQQPWLALTVWLAAIGLAFYALYEPDADPQPQPTEQESDAGVSNTTASNAFSTNPRRFTIVTSLILFIAALAVRLIQISAHPFILNGIEADIGLDALRVIDGVIKNPFSTAWLTNPTLPLFILSFPLHLFGASVFALRLLSAIVGALTVVATFLIGQRLWGRTVGLAAAVLLLGSHFHVHYSRLGITNVWDAFLVLLALGLIAIAWRQNPHNNRRTWLLAGLAIGFSAYLYTSSHLLPWMLLLLFVWALLFNRQKLRAQGWQILAALLLALVVALPQMMYYRGAEGVFMERANVVGILDSQSGWLSQETAVTGKTQFEILTQQFWQAALAFNATLDQSNAYGPFSPLLNFAAGVLFLLGLIIALFNWRDIRYTILTVWVLVTILLGGALLLSPPSSHRLIIAAPALSLLGAIALTTIVKALLGSDRETAVDPAASNQTKRFSAPTILITAVVGFALLLALLDLGFYFGPYRSQNHFGDRNTEIADAMAGYLESLEGEWTAYFYGPPNMYVGFPTLEFLTPSYTANINLFDVLEPNSALPPAATPNVVHIYLPERQGELTQTQSLFPGGQIETIEGVYANPLFWAYMVSGDS